MNASGVNRVSLAIHRADTAGWARHLRGASVFACRTSPVLPVDNLVLLEGRGRVRGLALRVIRLQHWLRPPSRGYRGEAPRAPLLHLNCPSRGP
eukprot:5753292-Prorocentrum_lima.AAC.1